MNDKAKKVMLKDSILQSILQYHSLVTTVDGKGEVVFEDQAKYVADVMDTYIKERERLSYEQGVKDGKN